MERDIMQEEANKIGDKIDEIIEKNPKMEYSDEVYGLRKLRRFILDKMRGSRIPLHNKENEKELQIKSTKIINKAKKAKSTEIIKKAKAKSRKASMKGGKRSRKVKGKRTRKN